VSPHKTKEGGELPPPATPPRVGPKTLANPQPTGVGNGGSRGAKPPWRGAWGVSPHKTKEGGEPPPPATPPRVGPKTLANPQPTGVGNWGSRGAKPPWRGAWGVSPHKTKGGGEPPPPATPPRVGPKTLANPQPTGVGKGGGGGASPLPGGLGDVPPKFSSQGASRHPLQPRHEWDPKPWQTLRGWETGGPGGGAHGGKKGASRQPRHEWDPKPWQTLSLRGWETGGPGGGAPMAGGVGGVPPQNLRRGRAATPCNPATSGTQSRRQTLSPRGWANEGGVKLEKGGKP